MIFKDKLKTIANPLEAEFENLFQIALENQTHPGDVLLIAINGWYNKSILGMTTSAGLNYMPYVIGPGDEGHSDETQYRFIHHYRKNISSFTYEQYLKMHEWDPKRREEIEKLLLEEEISIHLESMVYLKIWEGDYFIKTWFQFVQALKGEKYNWHFKVKSSNRDIGTGTAQELLRINIRDEIKPFSIPIYDAFKTAYRTQIRNAIAHSNFAFQGRNMHLHNYIESDPSHGESNLKFDEWVEMFHTTLILHNFSIWLKNRINSFYGEIYMSNPNAVELRVTNEAGKEKYFLVDYIPERQDWTWKR